MSSDNERIVKNTIFMYLRLLFGMAVSLYTSRVVLHVLGVDDFGLYNVIGGVVVLFTFINQAMATATQRYFSYELGKKENGHISKTFTISVRIHFGVILIVFILAETIGLWFINRHMNFPEGSLYAVNWVYQFSVTSCLFNILRVPYNGLIISYEKMSFYAVSSVVENILKLLIVYLLLVFAFDKLILYAFLTFAVTALITGWYVIYCRYSFKEVKYTSGNYTNDTKEIIKFTGWATFGSIANLGYQQGLNVILNICCGVVVNAAVAIATQINAAITQFVGGFQQALNPQLIRSEAAHAKSRQISLIYSSSKFSFFIMLILAVPIIVNMKYILSVWLMDYPSETIMFSQLIILGALIECISGPLWVTIFSTGNIRIYQIIISSILLLNLPLSYIALKLGYPSYSVFAIRIALFILCLVVRLLFLRKLIQLDLLNFIRKVILPIGLVVLCLSVVLKCWTKYVGHSESLVQLIWQSSTLICITGLIVLTFGMVSSERAYLSNILKSKFRV